MIKEEETKIIIYMPAFNVEATIAELLERLNKTEENLRSKRIRITDVIIVDDGSNDKTREIIKAKKSTQTFRVTLIEKKTNEGPISAIKSGIEKALEIFQKNEFDPNNTTIVRMDSDLEHQPEDLYKIILPIRENECDSCVGIIPIDLRNGIGFYIFNQIIGKNESKKYLQLEIPQFCPGFLALKAQVLKKLIGKMRELEEKFQKKYGVEMLGWDFIILTLLKREKLRMKDVKLKEIESKHIKKQTWQKIKKYYEYHKLNCKFLDSV